MKSDQVRRKFLDYFQKQGHLIVPSSPVVPHGDPSLLFCNAGMNQFKDVFLGRAKRESQRIADVQKCIRVGGKHNDLENVGHTRRHLTFFEMLGNFSFGDYFKKEAIRFAWEVSVEVLGFEHERLWVSVFREDDEAFELWTKYLPEKRIVRLGEKDNFWVMGDVGPCGPCSELLFDRGEAYGTAKSPYEDTPGERFAEFWNLVFMEFNRDERGQMTSLPSKNIDTGAGLERVCAFLQGVDSLFETDAFAPLIAHVGRLCGKPYRGEAPFKVIADHLRCLAFAISDGVQPSNVERGYVLRKVLRRAVRYGRQLGLERPFLGELLPTLEEQMGETYPELKTARGRIEEILHLEEEAFLRTLRRGGNLMKEVMERSLSSKQISGDDAFTLKDTYGLPIEEVCLMALDEGVCVDLIRYQKLEEEARERSRKVHKKTAQVAESGIFNALKPVAFVGYSSLEVEGLVIALVQEGSLVNALSGEGMVVLSSTPFYAEKGGQVGDSGVLEGEQGSMEVSETVEPYTGIIAHVGRVEGTLHVGDKVKAKVDKERRWRITHYHTATHLLHWALQEVLGAHVAQAGSLVSRDRLRFDFSHHKGLSQEEIRRIEDLVNQKIQENREVATYELPFGEVRNRPEIKQFFGDKYGDQVRVVDLGESKELCGGTHAQRTGDIGYFVILEERSVAAGVRRIVALTGAEAIEHVRGLERVLEDLASFLGTKRSSLLEKVELLSRENATYAQEMKRAKRGQLEQLAEQLVAKGQEGRLVEEVACESDQLKELVEVVSERFSGLVVLGSRSNGKCSLVAKGPKAAELIRLIAPFVEGGGGGKGDFGQAGGKKPEGLPEALEKARQWKS
ncbi:MAG: alanine--tRNA ligase [Verrucomicrobia bacterium]|nr:alanine--tRNA ligase [Verrucomicrobiota bacterium]